MDIDLILDARARDTQLAEQGALAEKLAQTLLDKELFIIAVAIPMDYLVGKALAAATDTIAYSGRTDTDTRCFNGAGNHAGECTLSPL